MRDPKTLKRLNRKLVFNIIKSSVMLFLLTAGTLFLLNDLFLDIDGFPTSVDLVRFFGGGPKPYVKLNTGETCVYYIDVGQADCELIVSDDYAVLIDSGDENTVGNVSGVIKYAGVERLDLVIVTHQHCDHMGGMYTLLQKYDVGQIILPKLSDDTASEEIKYQKLLAEIDIKNIPAKYASVGEKYILDDNSYIQILSPEYNNYDDLNNYSVVTKFVHGDSSFLFTGDLAREGELDLIYSNWDIDCDVLKVGHHGSAGSSSLEFLEKVKPDIAVFEVDETNYYGHPRTEVIERLNNAGCSEMYFTAVNGNIAVISDGKNLRTVTEKS